MTGIKAVPEAEPDPKIGASRRVSGVSVPYFNLSDSIAVARVMHDRAGGECDRPQLAAMLNYKGVKNGAFMARVTASKAFGLVEQEQDRLKVTPRARAILSPVTPAQADRAKVEAFLAVDLFRMVYEEYKEHTLPSDVGLRNLLATKYNVVKDRLAPTVRIMKESAAEAGFFKAGGDTRMVMPILAAQGPSTAPEPKREEKRRESGEHRVGGNGGGGGYDPPDIHPAILGLLRELPPAGTALSRKKRDALIGAFTATVGFIYPDVEENGTGGS
jgi:hypothetical protein